MQVSIIWSPDTGSSEDLKVCCQTCLNQTPYHLDRAADAHQIYTKGSFVWYLDLPAHHFRPPLS